MGMQRCVAEDKLDMVSTSVHVLALLRGGVWPVAGQHSFFYEGRIPLWWRSHSCYGSGGGGGISSPFPVCRTVAGGGPCACLYCSTHRVPRINTCGCMEWNDRV